MTCEELLRLLDEDGPTGSGDAAAHLRSCPDCRYAKEWWQTVRSELGEMRKPSPDRRIVRFQQREEMMANPITHQ